MNPFFYSEEAGAKGLPPLSPAPPTPAETASALLRTISLDDPEHFLHNHLASVALLRLLFTFAPERRSASFRNRCSPSPEYPPIPYRPGIVQSIFCARLYIHRPLLFARISAFCLFNLLSVALCS